MIVILLLALAAMSLCLAGHHAYLAGYEDEPLRLVWAALFGIACVANATVAILLT